MTMMKPSKPKAADPVLRGHLANVTSSGSVAFGVLEKEGGVVDEMARYNPTSPQATESGAEAQDGTPPVATWIEKPMLICRYCHFMEQYGDGPIEYIPFCNLCKLQMPGMFEEVQDET